MKDQFQIHFHVWKNTSVGTIVVLVLADRNQSSGDSGYTLRTIVLFQRSPKNSIQCFQILLN